MNPRIYLLDTNIVSYFIKGIHAPLVDRMERELEVQSVAISVITRAELRFGMELMAVKDRRRKRITVLLNDLPTLPWTVEDADMFGLVRAQLKRKGLLIGELDTQIGAQALRHELTLVTHNTRHFDRIPGLKLQDWMA